MKVRASVKKICEKCKVVRRKRVVRVNDVQLIEAGETWRVSGADVSLQGFVRRLMPKGFYGSDRPVEVIDWADVGYLATDTATVRM